MDLEALERYYDIKRTETQLVESRGFNVPDFVQKALESVEQFETYLNKQGFSNLDESFWGFRGLSSVDFDINAIKKTQTKISKTYHHPLMWQIYWSEDKLLLVYHFHSPGDKQIPSNFIELFDELIKNISEATGIRIIESILVANSEPSSESKNRLKTIPRMRIFLDDEFTYNPVKHIYNQQYISLSQMEIAELMNELKIGKEKLPGLKYDDPVARWYGLELGDVVRIIRTQRHVSVLAKQSCNYRIVIV